MSLNFISVEVPDSRECTLPRPESSEPFRLGVGELIINDPLGITDFTEWSFQFNPIYCGRYSGDKVRRLSSIDNLSERDIGVCGGEMG